MSRALRPIAILMAVATLAAAGVAAVVLAIAAGREIPDAPSAWTGPLLLVGTGAPACVGLVLAAAPARHPRRLDPAGRRAVGRGRDGRRHGGDPRARRRPGLRRRRVGARARDRVGRAVPVAARARLRLPGRAPALAALAPPGRARARLGHGRRAPAAAAVERWTARTATCATRSSGDADFEFLAPVFWACWFGLLLSLFGGVLALRVALSGGEPRAPPPGPVARLRRAAGASVARRELAREPHLRRVRRPRTCSC